MKKMMKKWMCLLAVGLLWPGAGTALRAQENESEIRVKSDTLRMTWNAEAGMSKTFSFEGVGDFVLYWGDGDATHLQASKGNDNKVTHVYEQDGDYDVMLCGLPLDSFLPLVYVDGGTFTMGATEDQVVDEDDNSWIPAPHEVTLDGFYIGKYEVTQGLWKAVMGTNPCSSSYGLGDNYPVYNVSWNDAVAFCKKLSAQTGKTYRLPTEAEWEYAARGGQKADGTKYAGSNNIGEVAWYGLENDWETPGNSNKQTHPVGQKKANGLGIYDMSGNVWEWCLNSYGSYANGLGEHGSARVNRGGCWNSYAAGYCRVSNRDFDNPVNRGYGLGFRVVCER